MQSEHKLNPFNYVILCAFATRWRLPLVLGEILGEILMIEVNTRYALFKMLFARFTFEEKNIDQIDVHL